MAGAVSPITITHLSIHFQLLCMQSSSSFHAHSLWGNSGSSIDIFGEIIPRTQMVEWSKFLSYERGQCWALILSFAWDLLISSVFHDFDFFGQHCNVGYQSEGMNPTPIWWEGANVCQSSFSFSHLDSFANTLGWVQSINKLTMIGGRFLIIFNS